MRKGYRGFTLLELMIAIAVIGLMALITAPNLVTGLPTYRIKSAVRDCTSALREARSRAIKDKHNVVVSFNTDQGFYLIDGNRFPDDESLTERYGSGVTFGNGSATAAVVGESIPTDGIDLTDNTFSFTSRGMADFGAGNVNGAIYFTNNDEDAYAITVNAAGAVAVRRWRETEWRR